MKRTHAILVLTVLFVAFATVSLADAVLFQSDWSSFVMYPNEGYNVVSAMGAFPTTCEITTVDGVQALHMAYTTGNYRGVGFVPAITVTPYIRCSVTFKAVSDSAQLMWVRLYDDNWANEDLGFFVDTLFWQLSGTNQGLMNIWDHNGSGHYGPLNVMQLNRWYTWHMDIHPDEAYVGVTDDQGNEIWGSDNHITTYGTNALTTGLHIDLFGGRESTPAAYDAYVSNVTVTAVPEPSALAAVLTGVLGLAGAFRKRLIG